MSEMEVGKVGEVEGLIVEVNYRMQARWKREGRNGASRPVEGLKDLILCYFLKNFRSHVKSLR